MPRGLRRPSLESTRRASGTMATVSETCPVSARLQELDTAFLFLAGDLPFHRESLPQRHCHKLPDHIGPSINPVQPRLVRNNEVILWTAAEALVEWRAAHGIYATDADFHGVRPPVWTIERNPKRL